MINQYGWNLLQHPIVLQVEENTTSFSLVDLPIQARKAKLHICLQSGSCQGESVVTWTLSTKVDMIKISSHPYTQNAWNSYSENCAIRLDEKKNIEISRSGSFPQGYFSIVIEVLGYK
ncbi:unnamed protein product [Paramecium octaurelia]|uniref:Uncharacterized protein n=1 Tax=Paramecium octaurelia TaxID=43137 RepID=A0A8S1UZR0_PAROT|nr:unnamed protein product [Paramecium octaurelia]CAD8169317.1 unnamed protein product [Paramecium octaurelia]